MEIWQNLLGNIHETVITLDLCFINSQTLKKWMYHSELWITQLWENFTKVQGSCKMVLQIELYFSSQAIVYRSLQIHCLISSKFLWGELKGNMSFQSCSVSAHLRVQQEATIQCNNYFYIFISLQATNQNKMKHSWLGFVLDTWNQRHINLLQINLPNDQFHDFNQNINYIFHLNTLVEIVKK